MGESEALLCTFISCRSEPIIV